MKKSSCTYLNLALICFELLSHNNMLRADDDTLENKAACEQRLSIEAFRAYALSNSPLVAEIDRDYANEFATAFETEVLANPELQIEQTFTRTKLGGADDPQSSVSIGQPIKLSNFGAKEKVAKLMRKAGSVQKRAKLLELNQKIALQFYTLYALQENQRIVSDAEERSSKKVVLIRQGVKKGLLSEGDEKLFEGEKYRLQAEKIGINGKIARLQSELTKALGSKCIVLATTPTDLDEIPSVEALLTKARSSELSKSTRAKLLLSLAAEQTRLSELDAYPQITPRLIYQHTNDGGDFIGAGLSMPLPFWNRNQGERIKTHAEQNAAEKKKTFLVDGGLEAQIGSLRSAAVSSKEQADIFSTKVVTSFEAALRSQEKLYAEGKGDVLQVWQTLRALNEMQTQGLSLWLEARTARIELSLLIGEEV